MAITWQFITYPGVLSGGGGGGGSVTWANYAPTGAINNVNTSFTLTGTPSDVNTFQLFQDGLLLDAPANYSLSGTTITMVVAPNFGQTLWVYYRSA